MKSSLIILIAFVAIFKGGLSDEDVSHPNKTTTTTVSPPTTSTTVAPTPAPLPKADNLVFNINTTDGTVCAIFQFKATIEITVNGTKESDLYLTNKTTVSSSTCNNNSISLVLKINDETDETLAFSLSHNESSYSLDKIEVNLVKNGTFSKDANVFKIADSKSFLCNSLTFDLQSTDTATNKNLTLKFEEFKTDAFRSTKDLKLREAIQCETDFPSNDFVPLAVGCALISLVFIVLVAYIVGRKRSRRLTYQSV